MTVPSAMQTLWGHSYGQPAVTPCPSLQMILNYVAQTGGQVYILNIWKVAREGEVRRRSLGFVCRSRATYIQLSGVPQLAGQGGWANTVCPSLASPLLCVPPGQALPGP